MAWAEEKEPEVFVGRSGALPTPAAEQDPNERGALFRLGRWIKSFVEGFKVEDAQRLPAAGTDFLKGKARQEVEKANALIGNAAKSHAEAEESRANAEKARAEAEVAKTHAQADLNRSKAELLKAKAEIERTRHEGLVQRAKAVKEFAEAVSTIKRNGGQVAFDSIDLNKLIQQGESEIGLEATEIQDLGDTDLGLLK